MSIAQQDPAFHCNATARAADIAQRCKGARLHGERWQVCCPAHEDHTPSLSITPGSDRVLLKCFAGCPPEAIMQALGLTMADLFVDPPHTNGHKQLADTYEYYDAHGTLLFQVLRLEWWEGGRKKKIFPQRHPDPVHPGAYLNGIDGVERVLYNLPHVLQAVEAGETIYIAEGEKDVKRLLALGLTATCNPMGVGKWLDAYSPSLRGAEVVIFPDHDVAGHTHAAQVAQSLAGIAARVTVVPLPDLPEKGDVSDWLAAGGTRDGLLALVTALQTPGAPPPSAGPIVIDMETVQTRPITWLWYPYIAIGKICILDGDPGVGKTLFATQLAANVSRGHPMPDQTGTLTLPTGAPGLVVFIATEDDLEDTVKPRLEQAGADCTKIKAFNEWEDGAGKIHPFTLADLPHLATVLERHHPRLVYIDAIQAVLGGKVDANRANQLKELLDPLTKLAATYRCAILASRHPAKPGQNNVKLIHRGANSMAIIGTARLGLFAEDHPTDRTKVLLLQSKSNAGAIGRTQIFSKAEGKFEWAGVSRITKEDLAGPAHGPDARAWLAAYFWLEHRLEGGLAWPATDIEQEATGEEHDLTAGALRKAKKALGVISRQLSGEAHAGWTWQLPPFPLIHYPSPPTDSSDPTDATDPTDTPDQKTNTYEESWSDDTHTSDASDASDVSVVEVVTEDATPSCPLSPVPATDCLPPPCVHCHDTAFWTGAAGQPICSRCHPQPRARS
jgi:putative DNA primase/helicase